MFLPTSEQAPCGPRTLRLDLYNKWPYDKSCHTLYKLRIAPCFALSQSYRHSHFRAACASLRAHTCCLRNRIQSLTRASRATILSAFSKSLYNKRPNDKSCHILYKASCSVASQLSQLPHVFAFSRCFTPLHAHTC